MALREDGGAVAGGFRRRSHRRRHREGRWGAWRGSGRRCRPRSLLPALRVNALPVGAARLIRQLHATDRGPADQSRGPHSCYRPWALHWLPRSWPASLGNSFPGTLTAAANRGRLCGLSASGYCIRPNLTTTKAFQHDDNKRSVSLASTSTERGLALTADRETRNLHLRLR